MMVIYTTHTYLVSLYTTQFYRSQKFFKQSNAFLSLPASTQQEIRSPTTLYLTKEELTPSLRLQMKLRLSNSDLLTFRSVFFPWLGSSSSKSLLYLEHGSWWNQQSLCPKRGAVFKGYEILKVHVNLLLMYFEKDSLQFHWQWRTGGVSEPFFTLSKILNLTRFFLSSLHPTAPSFCWWQKKY